MTSKPHRNRYGSVLVLFTSHTEGISTDQRDLGKIKEKKESTILFLSAWRKVHPYSSRLTMMSRSFYNYLSNTKSLKGPRVLIGNQSRGDIVIFWIA